MYESEIKTLKSKLELEQKSRISSNVKRPIFSPGRFSGAGFVDLSSNTHEPATLPSLVPD